MPAPAYGQITTTGSAQQIDPTLKGNGFTAFELKAPLSNAGGVFIGDASVTQNNGHQMDPGDSKVFERILQNGVPTYQSNPSDFYVYIVNSGDKLTWIAVR